MWMLIFTSERRDCINELSKSKIAFVNSLNLDYLTLFS